MVLGENFVLNVIGSCLVRYIGRYIVLMIFDNFGSDFFVLVVNLFKVRIS